MASIGKKFEQRSYDAVASFPLREPLCFNCFKKLQDSITVTQSNIVALAAYCILHIHTRSYFTTHNFLFYFFSFIINALFFVLVYLMVSC